MYERAYQAMKKRCLNRTNIYTAQANAKTQFREMLKAMGAFTALLNCAEVGRRNRILTNDRFLSHSLFSYNKCASCFWKTSFPSSTNLVIKSV